MTRKVERSSLVVLAFLAGLQSAAAAEDAEGNAELDEIVVTATRREQSAFDLPFTIDTRSHVDLQETRQVRTVPDAMREIPGVMVQKTGHGQGSPFIRGFTGLRTLFLIDGIRLNNSTFREGPNQYWNTVDPYSIQRLEVVKGPSSVLYGSDAIGGTVNAISRSAGFAGADGDAFTRVLLRGSTAENSRVFRPEFGIRGQTASVYAGLSLKNFGDLEGGKDHGAQPMTGYDEYDADLRIDVDLDSGAILSAAIQHVDQDDAWRVHRTVFGKSWHGTTTGNELRRSLDQRRTLAYLQYRDDTLAAGDSSVALSLSYHRQDEARLRIRSNGRIDHQGTDVATLGIWGSYSLVSNLGRWTVGTEVYQDRVDSFRRDFDADGSLRSVSVQGPVADDASYETVGIFVQNEAVVGDRSTLISGLRYTYSAADADSVQDPLSGERTSLQDSWNDLTASVRLVHRLNDERFRLFGGVSQGFRAPNLSDLTRLDSARSNEIETPVTGLDAEQFVTYEMGLKVAGRAWDGQVSAYYTDIDDLIIRTPTGAIIDGDNEITKRNSSGGYVRGVEIEGRYRVGEAWQVFGNLAWMDGEVGTYPTSEPLIVDEPVDRLMPVQLYLGTRWQPESSGYWLEGLISSAAKADELSTRDMADTDRIPPGGTPGYAILTLRGGWEISDSIKLSLALENLFDEDYRVHGSGLNEPGRNLLLSVFWTG